MKKETSFVAQQRASIHYRDGQQPRATGVPERNQGVSIEARHVKFVAEYGLLVQCNHATRAPEVVSIVRSLQSPHEDGPRPV